MTRYAPFDYLEVSVDDGIAVVRMGDPTGPDFVERQHPMHGQIRDVFPALSADPEVKAVVLTGSGDTFFAGPALEPLLELLDRGIHARARQMTESRQILEAVLSFDKPLVAAVNGTAVSMGCQLAFLSDFAVATTTARFQDTHVRLGLPAGDGGTMLWPLLLGMTRARSILLRGHPLLAGEAKELGLLADVVSPDQLLLTAAALAQKLATLPPFAYAATRLGLNQWFRLAAMFAVDLPLGFQFGSFSGEEFAAAIAKARARSAAPPAKEGHE